MVQNKTVGIRIHVYSENTASEFTFRKGTNAADRRRTGARNFCGWLNEVFHSW